MRAVHSYITAYFILVKDILVFLFKFALIAKFYATIVRLSMSWSLLAATISRSNTIFQATLSFIFYIFYINSIAEYTWCVIVWLFHTPMCVEYTSNHTPGLQYWLKMTHRVCDIDTQLHTPGVWNSLIRKVAKLWWLHTCQESDKQTKTNQTKHNAM